MKYSLDWLLGIRKNELSSIEMELGVVNNKISEVNGLIERNKLSIQKNKENLYSCEYSWKIQSSIQFIENCERVNKDLSKKLDFLCKERDMILVRYNNKSIEVKMLEKSKTRFLEKENLIRSKKQEAEINELSLISRKEI